MIRVVRPGMLTTIQDRGRPGLAHLGVPPSGAADRPSLALANRLVGNDAPAACLETTFDGCALATTEACWVAVTGARAGVTVDGRPVAQDHPFLVPTGATLEVGTATTGLRCYVAFRGGLAVAPALGSASCDVLSDLGPRPLRAGQVFPLGQATGDPAPLDTVPVRSAPNDPTLRLHPGPRADWFAPAAWDALTGDVYAVQPDSNRVGLRLKGPPLARSVERELPSEGMVTGSLQVPPSGQLIVFLTDHPTTGGYPVIACLHPADVAIAAQLRPGDRVRFLVLPPAPPKPAELASRLARGT